MGGSQRGQGGEGGVGKRGGHGPQGGPTPAGGAPSGREGPGSPAAGHGRGQEGPGRPAAHTGAGGRGRGGRCQPGRGHRGAGPLPSGRHRWEPCTEPPPRRAAGWARLGSAPRAARSARLGSAPGPAPHPPGPERKAGLFFLSAEREEGKEENTNPARSSAKAAGRSSPPGDSAPGYCSRHGER